jgi:hypothetical protein
MNNLRQWSNNTEELQFSHRSDYVSLREYKNYNGPCEGYSNRLLMCRRGSRGTDENYPSFQSGYLSTKDFKCCLSSITMDHVKDIQTGYLCVAEVAEAPMDIIRHFKVAIFLRRLTRFYRLGSHPVV